MKRSRASVESRRNKIIQLLEQNHSIRVEEIAGQFNVSPLTIRRDLQHLEDEDKIRRYYGGAAINVDFRAGAAIDNEISLYREKIAQYAASIVEDGDSIFINTSSTALQMIKYIRDKKVTVITNNGKTIYMDHAPCVTVVLTGGELREIKEAMVGEFAMNNLSRVTAKKSFLGCSGISPESGMTTEVLNEANVNGLMASRVSGHTYILCDHTKIGHNSSFVSCPIENISYIITDEKAAPSILNEFRAKNIRIHQVSKNSPDGL